MTWNRREKILASAVVGLLVVLAAYFLLFGGDGRSTAQLRKKYEDLTTEVAGKNKSLESAQRERKQLDQWRRRALPADDAIARPSYQNWLRGLANRANFRQLVVGSEKGPSRKNVYAQTKFTLTGRAALGDLVRFLFDFYSAGHLHLIRKMDLKPIETGDLEVTLGVEALSLPKADRKDKLTSEPGHELKLAKLEDYLAPIVKRNLFKPYQPDAPPPKTEMDLAQFAFVTGITEVDGVRQVWLQDRTAGKLWKLGVGEEFQVGRARGTVRTIGDDRDVTLDFDGRRRRLRSGENLRGGTEISEPPKADGKKPVSTPSLAPASMPGKSPAKANGKEPPSPPSSSPASTLEPQSSPSSAPAAAPPAGSAPASKRSADRQTGQNVPAG